MAFNYNNYLFQRLNRIIQNNVELQDYKLVLADEQMFQTLKILEEKTFYVVIKYLSASLAYNSKTQPVQMLIVSEQNSIDKCKLLFETFVENYNWQMEIDGTTYIKQQYNTPVVLSNFNSMGYGLRSVLYITGTLYIMEDVLDVRNLKVKVGNGTFEDIAPISFNLNYGMNGNTQQMTGDYITSTVKSTATASITMVVPLTNKTYITNVLNILNGTVGGNTTFTFTFNLGESTLITYTFAMKLTSASISTAPNEVTGLQLGFMK